jgi:PII-like signaling protein
VTADCLKLTSYFGERHRSGGTFTADALLELYGRHEIAASILLRGAEGFGLKHHLRTDRSLTLSEDLPLIAVAVDTRSCIETVLPQTIQLNRTGLVTLERARLLTDVTGPGWSPGDLHEATKLTVYLGRQERVDRVPAFIAVCDLLHRCGLDGATALLGVDGTAHGRRERAAFFSRNAEVPMMVIAVGSGERIGRVLPELGALLQRGPAPPGADPPGHRPPAALGRAQRRHHPARHLGFPWRPPAARRPAAATGPPRPRRHDRHRHPGARVRGVFGH